MYDIFVYYQKPSLNAMLTNSYNVVVDPDNAVQVAFIDIAWLNSLGVNIREDYSLEEYAQTIFCLFNLQTENLNVSKHTWKKAGHTSMSIGDYITFCKQEDKNPLRTTLVCTNTGWKVIDDMNKFDDAKKKALEYLHKLPIDIIMAIAEKSKTDPDGLLDVLHLVTYKRCENHCPKCGSECTHWQEKQIYDDGVYQTGYCSECGQHFTEKLQYVGTECDIDNDDNK
jgi:hypothetical protein